MDLLTLILIALGLSMDSFAVSVSSGLLIKQAKFFSFIKFCIVLALFQAIMPVIGWMLGKELKIYIESFDHWVAFILLTAIGGKMIWEGRKKSSERKPFNPLKTMVLLGLGLATSIDALIIGLGFGFLDVNIMYPVLIIGIITFIAAVTGIYIGGKLRKSINLHLEIFGGIALVCIGIKILIEHLMS